MLFCFIWCRAYPFALIRCPTHLWNCWKVAVSVNIQVSRIKILWVCLQRTLGLAGSVQVKLWSTEHSLVSSTLPWLMRHPTGTRHWNSLGSWHEFQWKAARNASQTQNLIIFFLGQNKEPIRNISQKPVSNSGWIIRKCLQFSSNSLSLRYNTSRVNIPAKIYMIDAFIGNSIVETSIYKLIEIPIQHT